MSEYEFILTFKLPSAVDNPADYIDTVRQQAATMQRSALGSLVQSPWISIAKRIPPRTRIRSAIIAVKAAIPGAELTEVKPDLINLPILPRSPFNRDRTRKICGRYAQVLIAVPGTCIHRRNRILAFAEVGAWLVRPHEPAIIGGTTDVAAVAFDANVEDPAAAYRTSRGVTFRFRIEIAYQLAQQCLLSFLTK